MKANVYTIGRKITLALTGFSFAVALNLHAQQPVKHACGNDLQKLAQQYPDFWKNFNSFENNWRVYRDSFDKLKSFEPTASGKYVIPVVVHVLHLGGNENITKNQILSQITALNKDFKMENNGLTTLAGFEPLDTIVPRFNGADTTYVVHGGDTSAMLNRFEFRLATKDPFGNCTDGIVRVFTDKTNEAKDFTNFKQISNWDRSKYYNLWIVSSIYNDSQFGSILGYAQFPFDFGGQFPLTSTDGVAVISNYFGTTGTASGGTGATTTHETGHWMGLFHIWGDDSCGSDGIDDTPIHKEPNFSGAGCFSLPKQATCYNPSGLEGTDSINQVIRRDSVGEMWMNFMDYTDDNCLWAFSEEQYRKMNVTMETISFRRNLSKAENLVSTGTDDAQFSSPCSPAPIADFWSQTTTDKYFTLKLRCAGSDVQFEDGTYNATPTSRDWTFEGGTPNTSTTTNPTVVYNTPGVYDVTLTSTNSQGSNTKTRTDYVHVYSTTADETNVVYYDDFEYNSLYEQGKWLIVNDHGGTNKWEQVTGTGFMSNKCMVMRNENNVRFERDALITASYNLQAFPNDKLYFRYAYANRTVAPYIEQADFLEVYTSTNCGETWTKRNIRVDGTTSGNLSGAKLVTAGLYPNGFVPTQTDHWKLAEVDLSAVANNDNVRVMFLFESGGPYANDFYLDVVNISNSQAIGIEEQQVGQTGFKVFPNPVTGTSQVYFNLLENSDVNVELMDLTGRMVRTIFSGSMNAGEQYLNVENHQFGAAGVYFVRLTINGVASIQKVVVE